MKVAVAATGGNIDALCDPRFGRCAWFVIVDTETFDWQAIENSAAMAGSGAGIQAAQLVAAAGADAVIAGNFGPNAYQTLAAGGIKIYMGTPGISVRDAVQALKEGRLQPVEGPTAALHSGMGGAGSGPAGGPGLVPGASPSMGRGMGGGRGRRRGRCGGGGAGGGRGQAL